MVGLSDIPCVGAAVDKASEATVEAAIRGLGYLLCYKGHVDDLKSEFEKVKIQEDRVSRRIAKETADGKRIHEHVTKWQKEVGEISDGVTMLIEKYEKRPSWMCIKKLPLANPVSRFRLGKDAAHRVQNVTELTDSGTKLLANEIAYFPPDENLPIFDTTYQNFGSRQDAYAKLWEAITNKNGDPILGIYGSAGVGKTYTMEQAWKEAKEKGVFDKITCANMGGQKVDVLKLQDQLAGYLDCHLKSEYNEVNRASQLKSSLKNGGKILIILDDVGNDIPLKTIGIPFGDGSHKGCKILLTSRRKDVCLRNNCKDPVEIKTLTDDEAWKMFENTVTTSKIESLQDASLAEKVCKACGCLPVLIHEVGKALKFLTESSWIDALYQLENGKLEEIDGIDRDICGRVNVFK